MSYKIAEFSTMTGLTAYTLRYYEKLGLLKPYRNQSGHREYSQKDYDWVTFIQRLKSTNMPLSQIQTYAVLRNKGDRSLRQRQNMLKVHQEKLLIQQQQLEDNIENLARKISLYEQQIFRLTNSPRLPSIRSLDALKK